MEDVGRPRLDAEALDALEREEKTDPLARLDGVEVGGRRHLRHALGVLRDRAVEGRDHRERLAERPLGLHDEVDVDGAHLQPDAALLEEREPRRREHVGLAEPALAVRELQQQVDVGVRDHGATIDARVDRCPVGTLVWSASIQSRMEKRLVPTANDADRPPVKAPR